MRLGGVHDRAGQGCRKALLAAAEEDIREHGAKGLTAWGLTIPVWMKASWYRKQGYRKVVTDGMAALMWKPLSGDADPPLWRRSSPELKKGSDDSKVKVLSLVGGICPASNIGHERIRKLADEYADSLDYRKILVRTLEDVATWGVTDGLYVNGKNVALGPPPTEKKLRKILDRELKHLKRSH